MFGLWSDRAFTPAFLAVVAEVFDHVEPHEVVFDNFLTGGTSANGVLIAR